MMRPRTATIQVSKPYLGKWTVEIGNPGASKSQVQETDPSLDVALVTAVLKWKVKEGLGV